jgi:hypothetical protein
MTTKKELLQQHGNSNIASAHLTNNSGMIIHYMDDSNGKILVSFVAGEDIISTHYVKFNHAGAFRIGAMHFNINDFIRSNY